MMKMKQHSETQKYIFSGEYIYIEIMLSTEVMYLAQMGTSVAALDSFKP